MVSAPHALAAQSGLSILQAGGNAADAAVAVAASLSVVYPHMTGLGGDAFIMYYQADTQRVTCYNGSGAAAALATKQFYRARGLAAIPERGGLAALTVPGAVDAWFGVHSRFGSKPLEQLLLPAINYAELGAPIARSLADALTMHRAILRNDEGAASIYGDERRQRTGELLRQPQLARTLHSIAREGRSWFYQGAGAHAIDVCAKRIDSPLRADDFAAHTGFFCDPLRSPFFNYESLTTPPNSQGLALLIAQAVLQAVAGQDLPPESSAALVHASVESIKLAFGDRDRYVADPGQAPAWQQVLQQQHFSELAARIRSYQALEPAVLATDAGDTAYFAVVDRAGNAVSYIQSLFHSFGAAVVVPELGIVLHNRGAAFSLSGDTFRTLQPRRRPFHTLMPCMLLKAGKPWLIYGAMGGEGQPQTALTLSTRIGCFDMEPQAAIEAPRWRWGKTAIDEPASVHMESRFGEACIAGLRARGHLVNVVGEWDESMGHAGAIVIGEDGVLQAGADPRGDGAAVGF